MAQSLHIKHGPGEGNKIRYNYFKSILPTCLTGALLLWGSACEKNETGNKIPQRYDSGDSKSKDTRVKLTIKLEWADLKAEGIRTKNLTYRLSFAGQSDRGDLEFDEGVAEIVLADQVKGTDSDLRVDILNDGELALIGFKKDVSLPKVNNRVTLTEYRKPADESELPELETDRVPTADLDPDNNDGNRDGIADQQGQTKPKPIERPEPPKWDGLNFKGSGTWQVKAAD